MGNSCCCCGSGPEQKYKPGPQSLKVPTVPEIRPIASALAVKQPKPQQVPTPITPNKPKIVVALYSYDARDSQDLSFVKGDRMEVLDDSDRDWLSVIHLITGLKGYIPGNFVAPEKSVESEDWFFENISRKEAEKLLLNDDTQPRGTFLIRPSEHNPNGYSLSVKDWEVHRGYHVKHYKIKPLDNGGFYISTNKTYDSLPELVLAYSKNAYGLCHVLSKPCMKPEPTMWELSPAYRDKWEIQRDEIQLLRRLGRGNFGEVFYGKWKNQYEVAVKTLREGTMSTQAFLQEAAIMKKFRHKRLVQLYGVCSLSEPVYIIQEYVDKGSLLEFLRKDQGATMTFEDQVFVAYQVASGMAHLESLKFIHRDLAARNVLLGTNNVAKICDFGLARMVKEETYLTLIGSFPIKWTAPEAALRGEFSTKSDVWSFGVFLTELFTFGKPPYEGIPIFSVMDLVKNGYRLPKPPTLPDEIYLRMLLCWHENPERRPNFKALEKYFESMDVTYRSTGTTTDIMVHHNRPRAYDDHRINFVSSPPDEQFEKY